MGRHVNSVSLNRSIEVAYKLVILYSGFLHPAMLCLFQRFFVVFCPLCLQYYLHFPLFMLTNRTWRYFWVSKWRKLGKTWNTEHKNFTQILGHY